MTRASTTFLVVMVFSTLGLWGCTSQKNGIYNAKIKELEVRYSKLEEDYRGMVALSEVTRKKFQQSDLQRKELVQQIEDLKFISAERDEMKKQVAIRTQERDQIHSQMSQFSKEIQGVLGRMEVALAAPQGGNSVQAVPVSRKSE